MVKCHHLHLMKGNQGIGVMQYVNDGARNLDFQSLPYSLKYTAHQFIRLYCYQTIHKKKKFTTKIKLLPNPPLLNFSDGKEYLFLRSFMSSLPANLPHPLPQNLLEGKKVFKIPFPTGYNSFENNHLIHRYDLLPEILC